ncbi:DamX protein [Salmonella enterica subsp. enterica]|uniref:DamX protein n=1 Tax=Salmonella enterica I TaxID=59201 RepID=A0A447PVV5_SALET|nr:DamX protein [Salmonella enterica subsp. enterica]
MKRTEPAAPAATPKATTTTAAPTATASAAPVQTAKPAQASTTPVAGGGKSAGNVGALKSAPSSHYTLQLSSSSNYDNLNGWAKKENLKNYVVYETTRNGQPWYVLVTGCMLRKKMLNVRCPPYLPMCRRKTRGQNRCIRFRPI